MRQVTVPYTPRPLQREIGIVCRAKRFVVLVCHRRFGKTVLGVNLNQQAALMTKLERPRAAYIGPTYRQSKAVAWDYMQHYARTIPAVEVNQSELRIDYPNKGQSRIFGADNPDSLRGIYLDRAVLDEYGLHPSQTYTEVIGPALVDRGGSAVFLGTPNGKNQFWEVAQHAKKMMRDGDPDWHFAEYPISATGLLNESYLAAARAMMSDAEYAQEFECSFEAAVKGAIFAKELAKAREGKRIGAVPIDPVMPIDTDWDLGVGDSTAIWFSQSTRSGEVRLVDYYENDGEGLPHYINMLKNKGYNYGKHWAPHDIEVREFSSGRSRLETARSLGLKFEITPRLHAATGNEIEEGIHAARMLLGRCWFDADRCEKGLEALQHYRRDYNQRLGEFKTAPVHDWSSHGSDAFRGLSVRHQIPKERKARQRAHVSREWAWT